MLNGRYKKILDRMPQGVFVFDDKLRVKFTNAAFRRSLSDGAKTHGTLAQALGCLESAKCGEGAYCHQCAFLRVMKNAVVSNVEQEETLHTTVNHGGRMDKLSMRIRVFPA